MSEKEEVLAVVSASIGRRAIGIGALWVLVFLLFYIALFESPTFGWRLFLVALGGGSFWMAELMRKATSLHLELTMTELRDSSGTCLARIEDIQGMDRGVFAFKPSNGFLLTLSRSAPRTWQPGMWWRIGRRVGVGGMTPGSQTKPMAEIISAIIAQRGE